MNPLCAVLCCVALCWCVAVKFTEHGRVQLSIAVVPQTATTTTTTTSPSSASSSAAAAAAAATTTITTHTYRFTVVDSGSGLSAATRAALFEPFSQGANTQNGTGLVRSQYTNS